MTSKFRINYSKQKNIDLELLGNQYEEEHGTDYKPYKIDKLQLYNPLYKNFFTMNDSNYNNITFQHQYFIHDLKSVLDSDKKVEKSVFIKFSPLLDPYRYMIGKYENAEDKIRTLPQFNSTEETIHYKIFSQNNASYVDSFFCYLSSIVLNHHNIQNGIDYYGSFLGIQEKFKINIADDLEYLRNSEFFNENIGKLFFIEDTTSPINPFSTMTNSRKNKKKIELLDEEQIDFEVTELDSEIPSSSQDISEELETVYKKEESDDSSSDESSSSEVNYSTEEESDESKDSENSSEDGSEESSDESEDSEDSEEEELYAYVNDFPIQIISMEKCDGTVDKLFDDDEVTVETGASLLFQVVMTLLIYQKMFKFTHNDLHTNNIMYINTDQEFLYYKFDNKTYKVPTYGKIYKLIDFGRAIYKYESHIFCSDSFAKEGDASSQYNCEPFFNSNRPRLEPNNSFDLCRLGSSLFDFLMEIHDEDDKLDELQKTVKRWCSDDNGKNILYKKNGQERYPSFKLYKMIARSVHAHTPEAQLEYDYFKQFLTEETPEKLMNIDELPCYYK